MIDVNELSCRFTYHKPDITKKRAGKSQQGRYEMIRADGLAFADKIVTYTPECREQSIAITKIEEAVFWANAAIARRENGEQ